MFKQGALKPRIADVFCVARYTLNYMFAMKKELPPQLNI
jgi:hypothetical protein